MSEEVELLLSAHDQHCTLLTQILVPRLVHVTSSSWESCSLRKNLSRKGNSLATGSFLLARNLLILTSKVLLQGCAEYMYATSGLPPVTEATCHYRNHPPQILSSGITSVDQLDKETLAAVS